MRLFWSSSSCLLHAILLVLILSIDLSSSLNSAPITTSSPHKTDDKVALLAFKHLITKDPLGALNSWNDSLHFCEWPGVTCSRRHRERVTVLELEAQELEGTLSPEIGKLSFLKSIDLTFNKLSGAIPVSISNASRLESIYLGSNQFTGSVPSDLGKLHHLREISLSLNKLGTNLGDDLNFIDSLTNCSKLEVLSISDNHLKGPLPHFIANLSTQLKRLNIAENQIYGNIPIGIENLVHLQWLRASGNKLTGSIPTSIRKLKNLETLGLKRNRIWGAIPTSLGNLTQLVVLDLSKNELHGNIPIGIENLVNLQWLRASGNKLTGSIPTGIGKLKNLEELDLNGNRIWGAIPTSIGNLTQLVELDLSQNELHGSIPPSLVNCQKLNHLYLYENKLNGTIPTTLISLSSLGSLLLLNNYLSGSFPSQVGKCDLLFTLDVSNNKLSGNIPDSLGYCSNLVYLNMGVNFFEGNIPQSLGNLTKLSYLDFSRNQLHGSIPSSLGNFQDLSQLHLFNNRLNGTIPEQVMRLPSLENVLLSHNVLSGPLPAEAINSTFLQKLDISHNRLSGCIPEDLFVHCLSLEYLHLNDNFFEGKIRQSLNTLKIIKLMDLSSNNLSGEIPRYLGNFNLLQYLNLSYNEFEGPVPKDGVFAYANQTSVVGNDKLYGGVAELNLNPCPVTDDKMCPPPIKKSGKSLTLKLLITVIIVCFVLLLCILIMLHQRWMHQRKPCSPSVLKHQYPRISYAELRDATIGFSADTLIGVGRYGTVYKGFLEQSQTIVAVKVLNLQEQGASKSFLAECNALRNLRHRNLVKIVTCCSSVDFQGNDFKALVYEFIPNGSLDEWLHPRRSQRHMELTSLNFLQRLNVAIDVASVLDYVHHHCQPAVVHCDLKPSNILLDDKMTAHDDKMTAHVSDFGLAKVFSTTSSYNSPHDHASTTGIKGSIGYIAPEYGMGGLVSIKGDVYSYGILLLEMFTGKRPTDDMFQDGRNLHSFAKMALPEQVMNIVDPTMLLEDRGGSINIVNQSGSRIRIWNCVVSVITLGVKCSAESPMERMNMGEVVTELYHIKEYFQGARSVCDL